MLDKDTMIMVADVCRIYNFHLSNLCTYYQTFKTKDKNKGFNAIRILEINGYLNGLKMGHPNIPMEFWHHLQDTNSNLELVTDFIKETEYADDDDDDIVVNTLRHIVSDAQGYIYGMEKGVK